MDISSMSHDSHGLTLRLAGELDVESADEVVRAAERAMSDAEPARVVMDLSGVSFIDSTGIGALLTVRNATEARSVPLTLRAPSPAVRRILQLANLDAVFDLEG